MMNNEAYNTISTNKIVIDKLIQILYNLRTRDSNSKRSNKISRLDKQLEVKKTTAKKIEPDDDEDNIYDDVDDYVPVPAKRDSTSSQDIRDKSSQKHSYFPAQKSEANSSKRRSEGELALEMAASVIGSMAAQSDNVEPIRRRTKIKNEPDSYAECYPGAPENDDALGDSDEEINYGKGESLGKKKALSSSRWEKESGRGDGDNKTNEGKGKKEKKKDDKAKFDRDLQRINSIISKRKETGQEIGLDYISEKRRKDK